MWRVEGSQGNAQVKDETKESSTATSSTTVLLRDDPEEATKKDILRVFEDDDGNVVSSGYAYSLIIFIHQCTSSKFS